MQTNKYFIKSSQYLYLFNFFFTHKISFLERANLHYFLDFLKFLNQQKKIPNINLINIFT